MIVNYTMKHCRIHLWRACISMA